MKEQTNPKIVDIIDALDPTKFKCKIFKKYYVRKKELVRFQGANSSDRSSSYDLSYCKQCFKNGDLSVKGETRWADVMIIGDEIVKNRYGKTGIRKKL